MSQQLELLRRIVAGQPPGEVASAMTFPPTLNQLLGIKLVAIDEATATMTMGTDPAKHANPMGTIHGGVLCDLADAAIGTAHSTTLHEGESFTSVDLKINFFRPVWQDTLEARATAIHRGRNISYYACDVHNAAGKLVAHVTSTVMTLRAQAAAGR